MKLYYSLWKTAILIRMFLRVFRFVKELIIGGRLLIMADVEIAKFSESKKNILRNSLSSLNRSLCEKF